IHTNQPERFSSAQAAFKGDVVFRPYPPEGGRYDALGTAHREAIAMASSGEMVSLLCADATISVETYAACQKRFRQRKTLILITGTRILPPFPPPGLAARALLDFTVRNIHPINQECFWGRCRTSIPSYIYFQDGENVTMHAFHLHPLAFIKPREANFIGTID